MTSDFAHRLRRRETLAGFWVGLDCPPATERLARSGVDYVCLDAQHGLLGDAGLLAGLQAVDAAGSAAPLVRVRSTDPADISRPLDSGACGVVVPLVDGPPDAVAAIAACQYPPVGVRSYGPMRPHVTVGSNPGDASRAVLCIVMIETRPALESVDEICRTPGLDGVYVGPYDLSLALGAAVPEEFWDTDEFQDVLRRVASAAEDAGIACGIHCTDGAMAARYLGPGGFTFATIGTDLALLDTAAREQVSRSGARVPPVRGGASR